MNIIDFEKELEIYYDYKIEKAKLLFNKRGLILLEKYYKNSLTLMKCQCKLCKKITKMTLNTICGRLKKGYGFGCKKCNVDYSMYEKIKHYKKYNYICPICQSNHFIHVSTSQLLRDSFKVKIIENINTNQLYLLVSHIKYKHKLKLCKYCLELHSMSDCVWGKYVCNKCGEKKGIIILKKKQIEYPNYRHDLVHITKEYLIEQYYELKRGAFQIAKENNCSRTYIYNLMKKFNLQRRTILEANRITGNNKKIKQI